MRTCWGVAISFRTLSSRELKAKVLHFDGLADAFWA